MFQLPVHKEVMAYKIYTEKNIKRQKVSAIEFQLQYYLEKKDKKTLQQIKQDWKQLIDNAINCGAYENLQIDIMKYAIYYCKLDCIVLMKGVEKFNRDLIEVFKQTKTDMLDVHSFICISSIGYYYAYKFGCFDECYQLSGKPQNFIQRCVSGGRTMTANNEKQYVEARIQDFDAVSLYPSAMSIMSGVPKGMPKIIPEGISTEELLRYDQFFAEINIKKLSCKSENPYKFGQVFSRNEQGSKIFTNNPTDHYYIDKRAFMDLMEFYTFDYEFIRGYYFDEGFNSRINIFIEKLFNLRRKYQDAKNPLQQTIKLLLNSIYGKSILKATTTETKCIPKDKAIKYIWKNYNYITEIIENKSIENVYVKKVKPINNHFNLPHFGASVLSWSKHCDFDSFEGAVGAVHSRKLIALGKKSYLDILVDEKGNEGLHIRLKGVPKQCILNKAKRMNISVEELYERMYCGEEIVFNLLDGANCFKRSSSYQQINLPAFERKIKF